MDSQNNTEENVESFKHCPLKVRYKYQTVNIIFTTNMQIESVRIVNLNNKTT